MLYLTCPRRALRANALRVSEKAVLGTGAHLKRAIKPLFAFVALLFLVHTGFSLVETWQGTRVEVQPLWILLSLPCAALAMLCQWWGFRALLLAWTKRRANLWLSGRVYLDSQMARYTPGKVGLPAVRIAGAGALAVDARVMASTLAAELLSWLGSGALVGGGIVFLCAPAGILDEAVSLALQWGAGGALLALILLVSVDRRYLPQPVLRLLGAEGRGALIPPTLPLWHVAHYFAWVACGSLLGKALGATWSEGIFIGGLLCVAIVAGFLAFLAPAGAGVREAVMALGVAPFLGSPAALALGVLARAVSLLSDVGLWSFFRMRARRISSSADPS